MRMILRGCTPLLIGLLFLASTACVNSLINYWNPPPIQYHKIEVGMTRDEARSLLAGCSCWMCSHTENQTIESWESPDGEKFSICYVDGDDRVAIISAWGEPPAP